MTDAILLATPSFGPASSRLPASLQDDSHARKILNEVFGAPNIIEVDAKRAHLAQAKLLGHLLAALVVSTASVEIILGFASARRTKSDSPATGGAKANLPAPGPRLQVSVDEYRWAHVLRMLALVESGVPVVPPDYKLSRLEDLEPGSRRQLGLGAVDVLVHWSDAKFTGGASMPGPTAAMSAVLMDAFLRAGFLEQDSPGLTTMSVSDQPSTLHLAIHTGNVGVAQSLLDFGVDLKRLPNRDVELFPSNRPKQRISRGDIAALLDFLGPEQPHTVALARSVLMREQILGASESIRISTPAPRARRRSRKGL